MIIRGTSLQRQLRIVDGVVEQFLKGHYSTLSSSVHAVGRVSHEFENLR